MIKIMGSHSKSKLWIFTPNLCFFPISDPVEDRNFINWLRSAEEDPGNTETTRQEAIIGKNGANKGDSGLRGT